MMGVQTHHLLKTNLSLYPLLFLQLKNMVEQECYLIETKHIKQMICYES